VRYCPEKRIPQTLGNAHFNTEFVPPQGGGMEKNMKPGYIYILANKRNGTLYTGVTSNLIRRVYEHKNNFVDGFAEKYGVHMLVYYEVCEDITVAIAREKQIKGGSRKKKLALIEGMNPDWQDLYDGIL
jgi:putative endonuclease